MALNSSKRNAIEARRSEVAKLRFKGKTQREIAVWLHTSLTTVNRDLKVLDRRWRQAADEAVATHRARQLAEISNIKKTVWLQAPEPATMRVMLQAIKLEAQIIGTLQPPSFIINLAVITQLVKAIEDSGLTPGDAFETMFKSLAAQKQERELGSEKAS